MAGMSRADTSVLGRWWWTVDRWTLFSILGLIGFGYILVLAASPAVAERIHQSRDVFILKQVIFLALAGAVIVGVSLLSPRDVRRVALGDPAQPGPRDHVRGASSAVLDAAHDGQRALAAQRLLAGDLVGRRRRRRPA